MKKIKKTLKHIMFIGLLCVFFGGCYIGYYVLNIISEAPSIDTTDIRAMMSETSIIYDDEGKKIKSLNVGEDRAYVTYDKIPANLINAYVALEDKTFFEHHGFNIKRIGGAIYNSFVSDGSISGTSTITQQLARNIYLSQTMSERSMKRKVLEAWYTLKIERDLSKEQILEYYLNTINLGFGNYGVKTAASCYFDKSLDDLTVAECAALAALPQAPSSYALVQYASDDALADVEDSAIIKKTEHGAYIANDLEKDRREVCLGLMKNQGYINKKQYDEAMTVPLTDMLDVKFAKQDTVMSYFTDYAVDVVAEDLETELAIDHDEAMDMIYAGGLRIYTTVDRDIQNAIAEEFDDNSNFPNINNMRYDYNGNILQDDGHIMLYSKDYVFEDGYFTIPSDRYKISGKGSVKIKATKRLGFDVSEKRAMLVLPNMYTMDNGHMYIINGGNIVLPVECVSVDDDWIVISSEYLQSEEGSSIIKVTDDYVGFKESACDLHQSIIQPQAAMTIIDNKTGQVKGMVGGRKISGEMVYNRAVETRQPGSSIKPLTVYSAALQQSASEAKSGKKHHFIDYHIDSQGIYGWGDYITAGSYVKDEKTKLNGKDWPANASGGNYGGGTVRKALVTSTNTCAYKIWMQVGLNYSLSMGEKFGLTTIDTEGDINDKNVAALALGGMTNGVTTLEMANAYTVFPNQGTKMEKPVLYTKVTDADGNIILENKPKKTKVLDPEVAFIMQDMMQDVVSNGTATGARVYGTRAGGKTGTTSSQYDIWFDGFTPKYSASLWIGNDMNMPLTSMSEYASRLWGRIMNNIPSANDGDYKKKPDGVVTYRGEYYVKGTI